MDQTVRLYWPATAGAHTRAHGGVRQGHLGVHPPPHGMLLPGGGGVVAAVVVEGRRGAAEGQPPACLVALHGETRLLLEGSRSSCGSDDVVSASTPDGSCGGAGSGGGGRAMQQVAVPWETHCVDSGHRGAGKQSRSGGSDTLLLTGLAALHVHCGGSRQPPGAGTGPLLLHVPTLLVHRMGGERCSHPLQVGAGCILRSYAHAYTCTRVRPPCLEMASYTALASPILRATPGLADHRV